MASSRRLAALELLSRLRQMELEQVGEKLVDIRREQSTLETERSDLLECARVEAQITAPEALPFVSSFLGSLETRRAQLAQRLAVLDDQAAGFEDELMNAFVEAKTQDIVHAQARKAYANGKARKDEVENNEVGQALHRRRRLGEGGRS